MDEEQVPKAFNEWMRRYIEEPERFEREFQTVTTFLDEEAGGKEASYGSVCTAYLKQIISEENGNLKS